MGRSRWFHLLLLVAIVALTALPALPVRGQEGTPDETPTGTLALESWACSAGTASTASLLLAGEWAPDATCSPASAQVSIDGGAAVAVASMLSLGVDAGSHQVTDLVSGVARWVEVPADGTTSIAVVAWTGAPLPTGTPTAEPTAVIADVGLNLTLRKHLCRPDIRNATDLNALADQWARLEACPVVTMTGQTGTPNTIGGQLPFNLTVTDGNGARTLTAATLTLDSVCESTHGSTINLNPNDNACWDLSGYLLSVSGTTTVQETTLPADHKLGGAFINDPALAAALTSVDTGAATFIVDPSLLPNGTTALVVDVFDLSPPRVTILNRLCPVSITSTSALDAVGDFWAKLQACPALTLGGDVSATGTGVTGTFGFTVVDGQSNTLTVPGATYLAAKTCEDDLNANLDGIIGNNTCYDTSGYAVSPVRPGTVTVTESTLPSGYVPRSVLTLPNSNDGSAVTSIDLAQSKVTLATATDSHVTLVFFNLVAPTPTATPNGTHTPTPASSPTSTVTPSPSATATVTPTPSATTSAGVGGIQVAMLFCLGGITGTTVTALAPGVQASPDQLGGPDCISAGGYVRLILDGVTPGTDYTVPANGILFIPDLPSTGGAARYRVVDVVSGKGADVAVEAGKVSRVIILSAEAEVTDVINGTGGNGTGGNGTAGQPVFPDMGMMTGGGVYDGSGALFALNEVTWTRNAASRAMVDSWDDLPSIGTGTANDSAHRPWPGALLVAFVAFGFAAGFARRRATRPSSAGR